MLSEARHVLQHLNAQKKTWPMSCWSRLLLEIHPATRHGGVS